MDIFIKIAVVPLVTGILTALVFVLIVKLLEDQNAYLGIKQWGKHLSVYEAFKIVGGIITLSVALYGSYSATQQDLCKKQENLSTEIVNIVPKISQTVNYEIGVGEVCYTYDGKPPNAILTEQAFKSAEDLRTNRYLLGYKIQVLNQPEVTAAFENYNKAIKDLQEYCHDVQFDELNRKKSVVNDANGKLIGALGTLIQSCYK